MHNVPIKKSSELYKFAIRFDLMTKIDKRLVLFFDIFDIVMWSYILFCDFFSCDLAFCIYIHTQVNAKK